MSQLTEIRPETVDHWATFAIDEAWRATYRERHFGREHPGALPASSELPLLLEQMYRLGQMANRLDAFAEDEAGAGARDLREIVINIEGHLECVDNMTLAINNKINFTPLSEIPGRVFDRERVAILVDLISSFEFMAEALQELLNIVQQPSIEAVA